MLYSGVERRLDALIGAPTPGSSFPKGGLEHWNEVGIRSPMDAITDTLMRGSSSSMRDPEQLGGSNMSSKAPQRVRKQSTSRSPEKLQREHRGSKDTPLGM